ncbi:Translation initiation factor eIF-2B subunit alpha [Monoraphidium neglectum]|uniref:Translation initiation factor eIF2B subunit alpha n=1 Tax=Monoraphidium neglectum TaxID=145388 RepID=A0A0D2MZY1_9CHLO|nr:Translation initiation factor eIF-2B subunit alpha [Monoraphidium neglectum]KIY99635.1 Translation initiation factor eIF-2B subunit alpha [Monoraphidium neglectum]|eukprot:XP_013898655.1 Translation initiation factor eIF-2B subunit alpha [Monoraphidium neglectum]
MPPRTALARISEGFSTDSGSINDAAVVKEFADGLSRSPDMAVAVAAIRALTSVIKNSGAQTMMGLEKELKDAAAALQRCNPTSISLKAGCELFLRYTTRTSALEMEDFAAAKARLIERGNRFADISIRARQAIAELGARFIRNGSTLLTHGRSRVVLALLQRAVSQGINFSVVVTEGRPDGTGQSMARALDELGVPVTMVLDSGVAYALERVDMVLVGGEGVVENGGVINKLGTYQIALCAKALNKPFYVAAESYKFARLYPLNQQDLPVEHKPVDVGPLLPRSVAVDNPSRDYTPPQYISLLVTDLGVLTPAAVSDELIQLYV